MTMRKQILSGLKWTAGAKIVSQIITWGITLIVMRLLTPGDYGLLAMASVFIAFMLMIAEAGLSNALVQKKEIDETSLRQIFGIVITVNICFLVIFNLLSPVIANFFGDERLVPIMRVLSLQFLFVIVSTIPAALLHRELKFKNLSLIELITGVFSSVLVLIMAFADYGVWSLVIGSTFGGFIRALTIYFSAPFYKLPIFSLQGMSGFLSFGGNLTVARFLSFFFNQADILIVGKLLGKEMLGYYSVAMHLASLPVQRVTSILYQVTFPIFSRFQDDRERLGETMIKAMHALSFFAFPVLWGIASIANEFVLYFLGGKWQDAILPLQLLALIMPLRMLINFSVSVTDSYGRPDVHMKNLLLASIVVPPAILIGSQWGIVGVGVAWVTVYPVVFLANSSRTLSVMGLQLPNLLYVIAPVVAATAGMYATVWGVRRLLAGDISQLTMLIVLIVVGVLMYGGLTLILNKRGYREVIGLFGKS